MSAVVKHDQRRSEILTQALDVFVDEGFENTTFQKIADRCGITRTTLYIYFRNKKDIFNYSIKLLLAKAEDDIREIRATGGEPNGVETIIRVMTNILGRLEENRKLLSVVLDYLLHLSRSNIDAGKRVRRRTIKLRHILTSLIIDGIKSGDIKPVSVRIAGDFLYAFIEAAIYRLVVLRQENVGDLRETAAFAIRQFAAGKPATG